MVTIPVSMYQTVVTSIAHQLSAQAGTHVTMSPLQVTDNTHTADVHPIEILTVSADTSAQTA